MGSFYHNILLFLMTALRVWRCNPALCWQHWNALGQGHRAVAASVWWRASRVMNPPCLLIVCLLWCHKVAEWTTWWMLESLSVTQRWRPIVCHPRRRRRHISPAKFTGPLSSIHKRYFVFRVSATVSHPSSDVSIDVPRDVLNDVQTQFRCRTYWFDIVLLLFWSSMT